MRITDLRSDNLENRSRVAATVTWEDCDRPGYDVYFEIDEAFHRDLTCNPNAFLLACGIPAIHYGERRIFIDGEICPELQDGFLTATDWLRHWFGPKRERIRIEARVQSTVPRRERTERAGFFFSGGIDSLATLRTNRVNFPLEHPWSIKDGLCVFGLEVGTLESFRHVLNDLSEMAQEVEIELVPVYTNLYLVYREDDSKNHFSLWGNKFGGAALAAVAHALANRFSVISIAATESIPATVLLNRTYVNPWGSHPLVDVNYSSTDLKIRYDGLSLSRLDKVKLIADWEHALPRLRVCNHFRGYRPGRLNCGQCEKCVRTMLALLAVGKLHLTSAFPVSDVSEEMLAKIAIHLDYIEFYLELLAPLAERGRHDLVEGIRRAVGRASYLDRKTTFKNGLKSIDQKYLKGYLRTVKSFYSSA